MKQIYQSPRIELIGVENEGVMATSGGTGISDIESGGGIYQSTSTGSGTTTHSSSELEDLINDLLTY
ncbi:hypothetical protein [Bacteroides sp. 214]|uniref:hypothetical protein n=1 Tax=Bacteroides sp. 214 TaxID=2302935 RepID=UPI001EF2C94A|nr:hypothetical protein [Bacteroides sp. 214]